MKAWLLDSLDGIEHLRLAQIADPQPGPQDAVLEILYAALNPADRYLAEGQYPAKPLFPHILGRDGVGTVLKIGSEVGGDIQIGQRYLILRGDTGVSRPGTLAEQTAVAADSLVPVPKDWSLPEAAGASLAYLTAYQAITHWPDLPEQAVILITGASGGVGVAATQLAHAMGHTVIGLSRNPAKAEKLKQIGAANVLDPDSEGVWRKQIGSRKIDLAIDNIGGPLFSHVIDTLGQHGRVSCVGRLAGPVPQFNTASLFFRLLQIVGIHVGAYTRAESQAAWKQILKLLDRHGSRPLVDHVYPFEQISQAFARLKQGPMGKVVIAVKAVK
jgi:NADPH2:quinone reductase